MPIPLQPFGNTGSSVHKVGLGCVTFGREIDESDSFKILDHAAANGINLLDTAEAYGEGASERILGRWFLRNQCRDRFLLVTKVLTNFTLSHVKDALDASLERLQTDAVDFYLMHQFDPATPLELALEAMTAAVESGKARYAGCSNFNAGQLRQALQMSQARGLVRLSAIQPPYSLIARDIDNDLLPLCRQENIAVMTYSPLAAGFLAGKYLPSGPLPEGTRFAIKPAHAGVYFSESNFRIVELLRDLSRRTSISMTRLAMGWVMANPLIPCVLTGARVPGHLDLALEAAATPLPPETLQEMSAWVA